MTNIFIYIYLIGSILAFILGLYILSKSDISKDNHEIEGAMFSITIMSWIAVFYLIKQILNNKLY